MNESNQYEVLVITSYPPRECGIANYSSDLIRALNNKFNHGFRLKVCALETESEKHSYVENVDYRLNTTDVHSYDELAVLVNNNGLIKMVLIQHEFGFFKGHEDSLLNLIHNLDVPTIITFHTVLPQPNPILKLQVQHMVAAAQAITVMTQSAAHILQNDYGIVPHKIKVIAHGTHLIHNMDKQLLKQKYGFGKRFILSTFGLMSSGKSIETTLNALPAIIAKNPDVLFLVIGKTHPTVVKQEGEKYRIMLEAKVETLNLKKHVTFINQYLPVSDLLEYLQLTDIYLFTSKDPNQAVSGTFSYAIGCGCPVISTPIPHAREVLGNDVGILIDFEHSEQLAQEVIRLLGDKQLRENLTANGLHKIVSTAWENVAVAHALLFEEFSDAELYLQYKLPCINLNHIKNLTTHLGMIQFSKLNHPDIESGYTIDDNARAMVAMCMHFEATNDLSDLKQINTYLQCIDYCMQQDGKFLNYIDDKNRFTTQNDEVNLDDANGRAVWALGYLISLKDILPTNYVSKALKLITKAFIHFEEIHSTRAIAFALKGLYYFNLQNPSLNNIELAERLASRLERMHTHESETDWNWYESYLTYGNSILPEGMLCAYLITGNEAYKKIAKTSFDFLLKNTFTQTSIKLISNRSWLQKGGVASNFGEQPIDVAYTILALAKFHWVFEDHYYLEKMETAFNWFLGNNHLHQIIYNPCTGGCYDGLEETHVNLNQGAESTVSYLMARLTIEKHLNTHFQSTQKILSLAVGACNS
jgi:glycosyltransferase involved in cell wall biosynthesis